MSCEERKGLLLNTSAMLQYMYMDPKICICKILVYNHCSSPGGVVGQFIQASPTCPSHNFTFVCNVTGDINGLTEWKVNNDSECILPHRSDSISICGPNMAFTATPGTGFGANDTYFTSTLSGTAAPALNSTLVECFGLANVSDTGELVGEGILKLKGQ